MNRSIAALALLTHLAVPPAGVAKLGEPAPPGAADWPQFRGPGRDGLAHEPGPGREWPTAGPPVAWRIAGGAGFSGIAVVGDEAYTAWQEREAQWLVALRARDGQERWRARLGPAYESPYGDGPRSTPVVYGSTVFAVSAQGQLHALRREDGRPLWDRDLALLGARLPAMGYSSTPLAEDGRLFVEAGGPAGAFLALDAATGEVIWRTGTDEAAYSSPIAATLGGTRQVIFFSGGGLHALAMVDGRPLWHFPWRSLCPATGVPLNAASPILLPPDRIFISSGYGDDQGAAVIRIVHAGERFSTETVWRNDALDSRINSAVAMSDLVYGFRGGTLKAVDAGSGTERWRASGFQRGSLLGVGDTLVVLGESGRLALVEATGAAYREHAAAQVLEGRTWTSPSLSAGRLYLRNEREVVCLALPPADPARGGGARAAAGRPRPVIPGSPGGVEIW